MANELPEGSYPAIASVVTLTKSTTKGTPEVRIGFGIVAGAQDGRGAFWDGWLTEGAWKHTEKALKILGWSGQSLSSVSRDCTGQKAEIVVKHEVDEETGRVSARVAFVNRFVEPLADSESAALDRQFVRRGR